ncbi:MAG: hypothetical protein ACFFBS_00505 [Promethearchaeota archaeon]
MNQMCLDDFSVIKLWLGRSQRRGSLPNGMGVKLGLEEQVLRV